MKKLIYALLPLGLMFLATPVIASYQEPGEDSVHLHYVNTSITSSSDVIAIELSSQTLFNLSQTGYLDINRIRMRIDPVDGSTGTVKLGVVNHINASTGSVSYFFECSFMNHVTYEAPILCEEIYESPLRLKVDARIQASSHVAYEGTTPSLATTNKTTASTKFQSDLTNVDIFGNYVKPDVGDVILTYDVDTGQGAYLTLDIDYVGRR